MVLNDAEVSVFISNVWISSFLHDSFQLVVRFDHVFVLTANDLGLYSLKQRKFVSLQKRSVKGSQMPEEICELVGYCPLQPTLGEHVIS